MLALGVYLRKNVIDHMQKDSDVCFDAGSFGKFKLVHDAEADSENLYPKKIVYEAPGALASLATDSTGKATAAARQVDMTI